MESNIYKGGKNMTASASVYEYGAATSSGMDGLNGMESFGGMEGVGSMAGGIIWIVIAAVIAIVAGIVLYFTFLSKRHEGKFKGFFGWLYEFWNFKRFTLEAILKITYLILSIFLTLASFAMIGTSILAFILLITLGNLVLRIVYEFSLLMLVICRNTIDINNKLIKKDQE